VGELHRDRRGAGGLDLLDRRGEDGLGGVVDLGGLLGRERPHPDPGALQGVEVQVGEVGAQVGRDLGRGGVGVVLPGDHLQGQRRVDRVPGHRAGGVLLGGDRHDAGAADQAEGRLQPDDPVLPGRADDRPVGLGADRDLGQRRGHAGPGTGGGAAGVAVEDVRVAALTAPRAPPASGVGGAEVRPLTQVGLGEEDRAGRP
jgi:hypothetical protein